MLVVLRAHWGLGLLVKVVGLQGTAAAQHITAQQQHTFVVVFSFFNLTHSNTFVVVNDTAAEHLT